MDQKFWRALPIGIAWTVAIAFSAWLMLVGAASGSPLASVCRVSNPSGAGTGFLVEEQGQRFVITNHHVVRVGDDPGDPKSHPVNRVEWPSSNYGCQLRLLAIDTRNDIAVLAAPEGGRMPALQFAGPTPAGEALICGFGGGRFATMRTRFQLGLTPNRATERHYTLFAPIRSGDSGSPVIVAPGRVVGICWGSDRTTAVAAPVTPIRNLIRWALRRNCRPGAAYCVPSYPIRPPGQPVGMQPIQQPPPAVIAAPSDPGPGSPGSIVGPDSASSAQLDELIGRITAAEERVEGLAAKTSQMAGLLDQGLASLQATVERLEQPITVSYAGSSRTDQVAAGGTLHLPSMEALYVRPDSTVIDRVEVPIGGRLALGFGPKQDPAAASEAASFQPR